MAAAPTPRSHDSRYWMATLTFPFTPASVIVPPGTPTAPICAAVTRTSSRVRSSWFLRAPSTRSNSAIATGTRLGCTSAVDRRVLPGRQEPPHPAERERAALVAGAHEELGVRPHERHRHRDL